MEKFVLVYSLWEVSHFFSIDIFWNVFSLFVVIPSAPPTNDLLVYDVVIAWPEIIVVAGIALQMP